MVPWHPLSSISAGDPQAATSPAARRRSRFKLRERPNPFNKHQPRIRRPQAAAEPTAAAGEATGEATAEATAETPKKRTRKRLNRRRGQANEATAESVRSGVKVRVSYRIWLYEYFRSLGLHNSMLFESIELLVSGKSMIDSSIKCFWIVSGVEVQGTF